MMEKRMPETVSREEKETLNQETRPMLEQIIRTSQEWQNPSAKQLPKDVARKMWCNKYRRKHTLKFKLPLSSSLLCWILVRKNQRSQLFCVSSLFNTHLLNIHLHNCSVFTLRILHESFIYHRNLPQFQYSIWWPVTIVAAQVQTPFVDEESHN